MSDFKSPIVSLNSSLEGAPILVGLMGAGKTSLGKVLARKLGFAFVDSDHEIENQTGVRIADIFEIEGEAAFRAREHKALAQLINQPNMVLATGGGIVLLPENRVLLKAHRPVIYLRALPEKLWERTRHDRTRPLLQTADPKAKLRQLYAERDPLYREVATHVFETGEQSLEQLAERVLNALQSHP